MELQLPKHMPRLGSNQIETGKWLNTFLILKAGWRPGSGFSWVSFSFFSLMKAVLLWPVQSCLALFFPAHSPITLPTSREGLCADPHLATQPREEKAESKTETELIMSGESRWARQVITPFIQLPGGEVDSEALQRKWWGVKDLS